MADKIASSPKGNGLFYKTEETFKENHIVEGDKEYIIEGGKKKEIKPGYKPYNENMYFDYAN